MRIIFSPTKTMQQDPETEPKALPACLEQTKVLLRQLRSMTAPELKKLWKCSDELVEENRLRLDSMELESELSAAICAFEGIAFKYLDVKTLSPEGLAYLEKNLRILSGFYGALKAFDGVRPYRLDMEHRLAVPGYKNLYEFWGDKIYNEVRDDSGLIINLASAEYSKAVEKFLRPEDRFINCVFVENIGGEFKQKATFSKMARGAMLRYMAENQLEDPEGLKAFGELNFRFSPELSGENEFTFEHLT